MAAPHTMQQVPSPRYSSSQSGQCGRLGVEMLAKVAIRTGESGESNNTVHVGATSKQVMEEI